MSRLYAEDIAQLVCQKPLAAESPPGALRRLRLRVDYGILTADDESFAMLKEIAHRRKERFRPFRFNDVSGVIDKRVIAVGNTLDVEATRFRRNHAVSRAHQYERHR